MMYQRGLWLARVGRTVKDETLRKTGWPVESRQGQAWKSSLIP